MENNDGSQLSTGYMPELHELLNRVNEARPAEWERGPAFNNAINSLAVVLGSVPRLREILSSPGLSPSESASAKNLLDGICPPLDYLCPCHLVIPVDRRIFAKNIVSLADKATKNGVKELRGHIASQQCLPKLIGFKKILEQARDSAVQIGTNGEALIGCLDKLIHAIETKEFDAAIGYRSANGMVQTMLPFYTAEGRTA